MSGNTQDIKSEIKQYWLIFLTLLVFNGIALTFRAMHIIFWLAILSALTVVLSLFMHLKSEKRTIHIVMAFTAFFLAGLVILIIASNQSVPEGTRYLNFDYQPKPMHIEHHGT